MKFKTLFYEAKDQEAKTPVFRDVFKSKSPHKLNKQCRVAVYKLLKKYAKPEDIEEISTKLMERKFKFTEGEYPMSDLYGSDIPLPNEFFTDLYYTTFDRRPAMGPGEILLWTMYNNISFNPNPGDLLIDGKCVEVKGARGQFGTYEKPWKSWDDAKSEVKDVTAKVGIEADAIDSNQSLVQNNMKALFKVIKDITTSGDSKEKIELGKSLINNPKYPLVAVKLEKALEKCKTADESWLTMMAAHAIIYQTHYGFEYLIKFHGKGRSFPGSFIVMDPKSHNIESLVKFFVSKKITPEEWAKGRSGGIAAK